MTIASNRSPHLQGFCVTSKVQRSMMRLAIPYCAAARLIPGGLTGEKVRHSRLHVGPNAPLTFASHLSAVDIRAKDKGTKMCGCLQRP